MDSSESGACLGRLRFDSHEENVIGAGFTEKANQLSPQNIEIFLRLDGPLKVELVERPSIECQLPKAIGFRTQEAGNLGDLGLLTVRPGDQALMQPTHAVGQEDDKYCEEGEAASPYRSQCRVVVVLRDQMMSVAQDSALPLPPRLL